MLVSTTVYLVYETIAKDILEQFTEYYYKTFDSDRSQLAPLYRENSMLTFEQSPFLGVANIVQKLSVQSHLSSDAYRNTQSTNTCNRNSPSSESSTKSQLSMRSPVTRAAGSWSWSAALCLSRRRGGR